jgi:hypothetical protein
MNSTLLLYFIPTERSTPPPIAGDVTSFRRAKRNIPQKRFEKVLCDYAKVYSSAFKTFCLQAKGSGII